MDYDKEIIVQFASKLYSKANSIIVAYSFFGAILGLFLGYYALHDGAGILVVGLVGLGIGYSLGSEKAFLLKLQAQTALCQVKIEENTRK